MDLAAAEGDEVVRGELVKDACLVAVAEAESSLFVARILEDLGKELAPVVIASVDSGASVVTEASLAPAAEVAEASNVALPLAAKVGYGPLLKLPCWPSGSS